MREVVQYKYEFQPQRRGPWGSLVTQGGSCRFSLFGGPDPLRDVENLFTWKCSNLRTAELMRSIKHQLQTAAATQATPRGACAV